jgi:hypothetical protein
MDHLGKKIIALYGGRDFKEPVREFAQVRYTTKDKIMVKCSVSTS